MRLLDWVFEHNSRSDEFKFFVIGDAHVGKINCMEGKLHKLVGIIKADPFAYWFDGGDSIEAIKRQDLRRWDSSVLPDWMLEGPPEMIRDRMEDPVKYQELRYEEIVGSIRKKCKGKIQGNHEYDAKQWHGDNVQANICTRLGVEDLTDRAILRLTFRRVSPGIKRPPAKVVKIDITHGCGGGRTPGAEPNHLTRLMLSTAADIVLRGHSHTFCVMPPRVILDVPNVGSLDGEWQTEQYAANWGCWLSSYKVGPPTYESRANYPPRPFRALEISIIPHHRSGCKIELRQLNI